MKKTKKIIRNLIIFILLIVLTFYIILKDVNTNEMFKILGSVKKEFIIIAISFMCLYIMLDAINIGRALKALNEKSSFLKNIKYSLIGFFFSAITPAATGGQPMQIYYMYKDNISVANSTLTFLINLSCVQIVTISIALFSLFFNYKYMNTAMIWFFIIGVGLNLSALILLLISILSKRMTKGLINIAIKILKFFKIKNIEEKQTKLENELKKYQSSAAYIKNNKRVAIRTLLTTYIQYIIYYSITYWVYRSFGLSGHNVFEIVTMQSVLYATVSGIPSPGAVGVSEGAFIALYSSVFTENMLKGAMLLTRGVNFYLFVILSSIVSSISAVKERKLENNEYKDNIEIIE